MKNNFEEETMRMYGARKLASAAYEFAKVSHALAAMEKNGTRDVHVLAEQLGISRALIDIAHRSVPIPQWAADGGGRSWGDDVPTITLTPEAA